MKLQRIFTLSLLVFLLSACTQRRYASITGFQWKSQETAKRQLTKGHYVSPVETKTSNETEVAEVTTKNHSANAVLTVVQSEKSELGYPKTSSRLTTADYVSLSNDVTQGVKQDAKKQLKANPVSTFKTVKSAHQLAKQFKPQSELQPKGGLIYWILVIVLILLIISLLRTVLGPVLWGLLGTLLLILLILLLGNYLGLW